MKQKTAYKKLRPAIDPILAELIDDVLKQHDVDPGEAEVKRTPTAVDAKDIELEEGSRTAIQFVSTRTIDRDGEILLPKGAVLSEFRKAPQVLWGHDYSIPPIGSDTEIKADRFGLLAKTQYSNATELARDVFGLKQEGHLRTSSVGFIPLERVSVGDDGFDKSVTKLVKDFPEVYPDTSGLRSIIKRWVVLEHSDVSVPANPDALSIAVSKGYGAISEILARDLGIDTKSLETEGELEAKEAAKLAIVTVEWLEKNAEKVTWRDVVA